MNSTQAKFKARSGGQSQCAKILAKLKARRGKWVPMPDLWRASKAFAVHSRIADLRQRGHDIENGEQRSPDGTRTSFYRLN